MTGCVRHCPSVSGGSIMVMFQRSKLSCTGSTISAHTVDSFKRMSIATMKRISFMIWKNLFWGPFMFHSGLEWADEHGVGFKGVSPLFRIKEGLRDQMPRVHADGEIIHQMTGVGRIGKGRRHVPADAGSAESCRRRRPRCDRYRFSRHPGCSRRGPPGASMFPTKKLTSL